MLRNEGAEILVHCGDFTNPEVLVACTALPLYFVLGNCDTNSALELAAQRNDATCLGLGGEVDFAGKRVAVTHGHMTKDLRRLLAAKPDYLLTGHSHIAADWIEGSTRRINPGALFRAANYSVAMLDLGTDDLQFIEIE